METNRRVWNTLETTVSYKAWARLSPTLTHVVTYELVTSGAEDRAMSLEHGDAKPGDQIILVHLWHFALLTRRVRQTEDVIEIP
jgi:hypothetical protein